MNISAPPSPPINLRVKEFTSRTCTIQWESPENDGGSEIIGYVIEKKLEYVPKWEKVVTLEAFSLEYTAVNLKDKSDYVFRVSAENAVGLSVPATTDIVHLRSHASKYQKCIIRQSRYLDRLLFSCTITPYGTIRNKNHWTKRCSYRMGCTGK